jgi:hypothetical protein
LQSPARCGTGTPPLNLASQRVEGVARLAVGAAPGRHQDTEEACLDETGPVVHGRGVDLVAGGGSVQGGVQ